jgi:hypothetical protein
MPPVHLDQMLRYCGALTQVTGQSTVFMNGKLAAVEGDKDTHNDGGDLIQQYGPGNIFIGGKKLIVAMGDRAAPDSQGLVQHPFSPTDPAQGSSSVFAYGGKAGGGLGNITGGDLNIGELVSINGQVVGQVKNFINIGNGQASAVIQNMGSQTPQAGQTIVGQDTGNSLTLTNFERSNAYDLANTSVDYTEVMIVAVTDDAGVIAVDQHFTGKPSQDYNSRYVVTSE